MFPVMKREHPRMPPTPDNVMTMWVFFYFDQWKSDTVIQKDSIYQPLQYFIIIIIIYPKGRWLSYGDVRCQVPTRACSWCCHSNWTSSRDPFSSTRWTLGLCLPSQVFQSWQKSEWFVISLIIPKCILNIHFTWEQTVPDSELKLFS